MTETVKPADDHSPLAPDRTITIQIAGALAWTSADVEGLLASALQYNATGFDVARGNVRRRQTDVRTYEVVEGYLIFPAAQVTTVEGILGRAGYSVEVQPAAPAQSPLLEPYRPTLEETDDLGRSFLAAIDREQRGIIELPQGELVAPWIGLIVKWFVFLRQG